MATAGIFCSATRSHQLGDIAGAVEQGVVGMAMQVDERGIGHGPTYRGRGHSYCNVSNVSHVDRAARDLNRAPMRILLPQAQDEWTAPRFSRNA